jgi:methyladenine glycosylase
MTEREYGFPSRKDKVLFERLVLEINQAGLSGAALKKLAAFATAFDGSISTRWRPMARGKNAGCWQIPELPAIG